MIRLGNMALLLTHPEISRRSLTCCVMSVAPRLIKGQQQQRNTSTSSPHLQIGSSARSRVKPGQTAKLTRIFVNEDLIRYGRLTGDTNPIHMSDEIAEELTGGAFPTKLVHGALINGLVSAVIGTICPGPGSIVARQTINYLLPLHVDEEVCATVEVKSVRRSFAECQYDVTTTEDKRRVLEGHAMVLVPRIVGAANANE